MWENDIGTLGPDTGWYVRTYWKFIRTRVIYFIMWQYARTGPSEYVRINSVDTPSSYGLDVYMYDIRVQQIFSEVAFRKSRVFFRSNTRDAQRQYNIIYSYIRMSMYKVRHESRCMHFFSKHILTTRVVRTYIISNMYITYNAHFSLDLVNVSTNQTHSLTFVNTFRWSYFNIRF